MICDNCIHNAVCDREHFENHCGYKHTEADIINPELEKIKQEIQDLDLGFVDREYQSGVAYGIMKFNQILDKYIKYNNQ